MRDLRTHTVLRLVIIVALLVSMLPLSGCDRWFDGDIWDLIHDYLEEWAGDGPGEEQAEEQGNVELALLTPAGASPNVFTTGWVFGARCTVTDEDGNQTDLSNRVKWSGTGSFSPQRGDISRPSFSGPGMNTIKISIDVDGKTYEQEFNVSCVSPDGYASVGDLSKEDGAHGHGCIACPHPSTVGPITVGSPNVLVRGKPAARVGDPGIAAACCGPNEFEITGGDASVMINGRPAAKIGSETLHCGVSIGHIISGGN